MFELKRLNPDGIERSLEKAHLYRLLNEPEEAESICLDILAVAPGNQRALVTLLLALTDQIPHEPSEAVRRAHELLPQLDGEYARAYYAGIIAERRANVHLATRSAGAEAAAFELYRLAMDHYEKAEPLAETGNDDARLRWNTCARQITRHGLKPAPAEPRETLMLE